MSRRYATFCDVCGSQETEKNRVIAIVLTHEQTIGKLFKKNDGTTLIVDRHVCELCADTIRKHMNLCDDAKD